MSQPKRYDCLRQFGMLPAEDGIWVEYADYAALAAENESIVKHCQELQKEIDKLRPYGWEHHLLAAENDRLRKAGDAMAEDLRECQADEDNKLLVDWEAAKEGRDAK